MIASRNLSSQRAANLESLISEPQGLQCTCPSSQDYKAPSHPSLATLSSSPDLASFEVIYLRGLCYVPILKYGADPGILVMENERHSPVNSLLANYDTGSEITRTKKKSE